MEELHPLETVVAALAAGLGPPPPARRVLIPYPIFLVLGGLVIGVLPRVPVVRLDPDIVFLIFLPPVLYSAAYFTSLRDFRANLRPITLLAVGLVLATTAVVAAVARVVIPGLSWPAAIALGAIVSPPDAVAATPLARRRRGERHRVTPRHPVPDRDRARGREPHQRCGGPGALSLGGGGGRHRGVLALADALAVRPDRGGRRADRLDRRRGGVLGAAAHRGQPHRDRDHPARPPRPADPGRAHADLRGVRVRGARPLRPRR